MRVGGGADKQIYNAGPVWGRAVVQSAGAAARGAGTRSEFIYRFLSGLYKFRMAREAEIII